MKLGKSCPTIEVLELIALGQAVVRLVSFKTNCLNNAVIASSAASAPAGGIGGTILNASLTNQIRLVKQRDVQMYSYTEIIYTGK